MKSVLLILILAAMAALCGVLLLRFETPDRELLLAQGTVHIEGVETPVAVAIADTAASREKGLSGREGLGENEGMIFLFTFPHKPSFWMKDMRFPIDIIWISDQWRIVDITEDVVPESYPDIFSPAQDATYVLEVGAGFSAEHNLMIGQTVTLEK